MKNSKLAFEGKIVLFLTLVVISLPASFAQVFSVTALEDLSTSKSSSASGINVFGQVVGLHAVTTSFGTTSHAFLWTRSSGMRDLGTLPGGIDQPAFSSWASAINSFGQVGGGSWIDLERDDAFLWTRASGMEPLGAVGIHSSANALNDVAQAAVTQGVTQTLPPRAFRWSKATGLLALGTLPGGDVSYANGINNLGEVVGSGNYMGAPGFLNHAFLWTKKRGMQDLGTLGGTWSIANGINDSRQVVGTSETPSSQEHAFLWTSKSGMKDLGTLPGGTDSVANAVSIFGYVVGGSNSTNSQNLSHAFLWSPRTGMWDLNDLIPSDSGWVLLNATAINAWGQITGNGMINGEMHGFLLTPNLQ